MQRLGWFLAGFLLLLGLGGGAVAGPTDPVTVTPLPPVGGGVDPGVVVPGFVTVADLAQPYVEEEFLVSGFATVYTYEEVPDPKVILPLDPDVPYTTRIIVRRPADPADFNGTVLIEWWNSTAGFDTSPVWDPSAEYFAREGFGFVGVTNSTTSIGFLKDDECGLFGILPPACVGRYSALEMSENGQAFEMVSQIATLLKSADPDNPFPPGYTVERIYHAGQSQQGGSMVTYATAFHFPANDGYFVQAAGNARPINFGPECGEVGSPPYPGCTPRLVGTDRQVATDLPVPVYRVLTETDIPGAIAAGSRQTDTPTFRYWETAGSSHVHVHLGVEVLPAGVIGPNPLLLEDTCLNPLNTLLHGPIVAYVHYNAMWDAMEQQVRFGTPPPTGSLVSEVGGEIQRDVFGNAIGGIRVPQMDVPVATYSGRNLVDPTAVPGFLVDLLGLFCRLAGTVTPFGQATLDALYPNEGVKISQLAERADALLQARFLLPEDLPAVVPSTLLGGKILRVGDRAGNANRRRLFVASRDKAIWTPPLGGLGDPTVGGAVLGLVNPTTGESTEVDLPASGWKPLGSPAGSRGYSFNGGRDGTCRRVVVRPSGSMLANCRGAGIDFSLDESSQGSLAVTLQLGGLPAFCMEFGGNVTKDQGTGASGRGQFRATASPTPAACPGP